MARQDKSSNFHMARASPDCILSRVWKHAAKTKKFIVLSNLFDVTMNFYSCFYVKTARDVVTVLLIFAKYLSLYLHVLHAHTEVHRHKHTCTIRVPYCRGLCQSTRTHTTPWNYTNKTQTCILWNDHEGDRLLQVWRFTGVTLVMFCHNIIIITDLHYEMSRP